MRARRSNVKYLLKEMKDLSELMVDLAYSATMFDLVDIAEEVLRMEERITEMLRELRISTMLAARTVEDAEKLNAILQIASSAEKIANAAVDIARIVLRRMRLPIEFKKDLMYADETVVRAKVLNEEIDGKTLGELKLKTITGMRVIAIRRGTSWIYDPDRDTTIHSGDILIARGPDEGVPEFYRIVTGEICTRKEYKSEIQLSRIDIAVDIIIEMKNTSELAVDLAYSAVLFQNRDIADEVRILENSMNEMKLSLERWVLEAAREIEDVSPLQSLLHLAQSSEMISNAAYEMAYTVIKGMEIHPIIALAMRESDEVITRLELEEGCSAEGKTIGELEIGAKTGMTVVAIRRGDKWIFDPDSRTVLKAGDLIIAKGTRLGEEMLKELLSSKA
ncbi:MAG: potassium channel protein [Archaeoglobi archaeon]|nr:potassium channel protein [Candidatus Mnemosynella sp.]